MMLDLDYLYLDQPRLKAIWEVMRKEEIAPMDISIANRKMGERITDLEDLIRSFRENPEWAGYIVRKVDETSYWLLGYDCYSGDMFCLKEETSEICRITIWEYLNDRLSICSKRRSEMPAY